MLAFGSAITRTGGRIDGQTDGMTGSNYNKLQQQQQQQRQQQHHAYMYFRIRFRFRFVHFIVAKAAGVKSGRWR